ncbi:MAG: dGTP triphosphohydrolase [Planctomycetota bacterium]|jgi:dGTPase
MLLRELNEAREYRELAPYALKSADTRGRLHVEKTDKFRPVYLRDRDRVIHSSAFRRLEYKTQVFVNNEGDYYRTRLTHTLEVAQIARSAAYSLRLNEGFVEALSLAHDLGHPPFGHAGEEILNRLMEPFGGFEHNRQGLRIVDHLEVRYPGFSGLNLTCELRESILKTKPLSTDEGFEAFAEFAQPFLEAQVVDLADRVAYTHHDLDDGLQAGILSEEELRKVKLWRKAAQEVEHAHKVLSEAEPDHAEQARRHEKRLITLSPEMETLCSETNRYLDENFYRHYRVARMVVRSERILNELFHGFLRRPETLPPDYQDRAREAGLERSVCDYIAGMTDRFAEDEWNRLRF